MHDLSPAQTLLFSWLAAESAAARRGVLDAHADMLTPELMHDMLALATGGPSYGGDRDAEARFQVELLELAVAVADAVGTPEERAEAQRLLAASLGEVPGGEARRVEMLTSAALEAEGAGRWAAAYRARHDLARLWHGLGKGRDALEAYDAALAMAVRSPELAEEAEELLEPLVAIARKTGRTTLGRDALRRYVTAARQAGDRSRVGRSMAIAGDHFLSLECGDEARGLLLEAAALLGEMGEDDALARAHLRLLELSFQTGDVVGATRHLEEVVKLRERITDPGLLADIDGQFGQFF